MAISLYDTSVKSYLQILPAVAGILDKAESHCADNGLDTAELVETRLHPDMLPLRFQLISVGHHSLGAIKGLQAGEFAPPPSMPDADYAALREVVTNATAELKTVAAESIDGLAGKQVMFRAGKMEVPFTAENFILSFSLPNFYFHATTTYDILRMKGVPLGKLDFLGQLRAG